MHNEIINKGTLETYFHDSRVNRKTVQLLQSKAVWKEIKDYHKNDFRNFAQFADDCAPSKINAALTLLSIFQKYDYDELQNLRSNSEIIESNIADEFISKSNNKLLTYSLLSLIQKDDALKPLENQDSWLELLSHYPTMNTVYGLVELNNFPLFMKLLLDSKQSIQTFKVLLDLNARVTLYEALTIMDTPEDFDDLPYSWIKKMV